MNKNTKKQFYIIKYIFNSISIIVKLKLTKYISIATYYINKVQLLIFRYLRYSGI